VIYSICCGILNKHKETTRDISSFFFGVEDPSGYKKHRTFSSSLVGRKKSKNKGRKNLHNFYGRNFSLQGKKAEIVSK
jgi:hypothetical protein